MTIVSLLGKYDVLGGHIDEDNPASVLLRVILIFLMLIHWFYGAIYYPLYYRRYLKTISRGNFTQNFPNSDASYLRGYIAIIVLLGIILQILHYRGLVYIVPDLVWLALLAVASFASRTDKMFCKRTIKINQSIIMSALFKETTTKESKDSYEKISYLVAKEERGRNVKKMVVKAYCQAKIKERQEDEDEDREEGEEEERKKADILSTQIAEEMKA